MRQNNELTKIKARIKALAEKTVQNGCSEAEAMSAAKMVGKLLELYSLSMDEIDIREEPCITLTKKWDGARRRPIADCLVALAQFCDCKVWVTTEHVGYSRVHTYDGIRYRAKMAKTGFACFGHEADAQMMMYLADVIEKAVAAEVRQFKTTPTYLAASSRRTSSDSFQKGMVERIATRLVEMKEARDREMAAARNTGTALIVLKGTVIEEEFEKTGIRLRTTYVRSTAGSDSDAYARGNAAGDRVNLNRPVNRDRAVSDLIGA